MHNASNLLHFLGNGIPVTCTEGETGSPRVVGPLYHDDGILSGRDTGPKGEGSTLIRRPKKHTALNIMGSNKMLHISSQLFIIGL
jgi:hypothetical protein